MVIRVIFDTGNENYEDIHGNMNIGRIHRDKQNTS